MKKTIFIVGGSSGIGQELVNLIKEDYNIITASRNPGDGENQDITSFPLDVTSETMDFSDLPESLDGFVYCPGKNLP